MIDAEMYRYVIIGALVAGAFAPRIGFAFLAGLFLIHHFPYL